jgi:hypothetical protein
MAKKKVAKKELKEQSMSWKSGCCKMGNHAPMGCGYGLGFIGAVVYYVSTATSFGMGLVGVLKAFVWPAFLVFKLLQFLGM